MSKELEALKDLASGQYVGAWKDQCVKTIEKALKRLELIDKISPYAVNYDFGSLDKKITALSIKLNEKDNKIKALEIIKNKAKIVDYSPAEYPPLVIFQGFRIDSKEEYDLLKEVLSND